MNKKDLFFQHIGDSEFLFFAYYLLYEDLPENLSKKEIKEKLYEKLLMLPSEDFIEYAYLLILLRSADSEGKKAFLEQLKYKTRSEILDIISRSKEAKQKKGIKFTHTLLKRLFYRFLPLELKRFYYEHEKEKLFLDRFEKKIAENEKKLQTLLVKIDKLQQHPKFYSPTLSQTWQESLTFLENAKEENRRMFGEESENFYLLFENIFYNSSLVTKLQQIYLPYIKGPKVLDVGCGRGEMLQMLLSQGVDVEGIDINEAVIKLLQKRDLPVKVADVFDYLPGKKYDTILALEVVEHFTYDQIDLFLSLSLNALNKKGHIIIETPNPLASIGIGNFYMDITHKRPIPPRLLAFWMEYKGFQNIHILYSSPVPKEYQSSIMEKNYQNYAVIGEKI